MSRVTRRLRRQRRQARRAAHQQRRQGQGPETQQVPEQSSGAAEAGTPRPARHAAGVRRAPRGPRALTLAAGLGILALGAGSAVLSALNPEGPATGASPVHTVELDQGAQPEVCPPTHEDADVESLTLGDDDDDDAASAVIHHAEEGPSASLASSYCTVPQRRQVFLGPETGGGADSALTLTNPYDRPATVEVTTVGEDGDRGALGSTTVLVPAEEDRQVSIAGLAEGEEPLAVEVTASGAPVAADLRSARTSGSTSLGAELLTGQVEPEAAHALAGVPMPDAGSDTDPAELWLYVPESEHPGEAAVELQVFGPEGHIILETPGVFTQPQGTLSVVELEGVEDPGTYDLLVTTTAQSGAEQEPVPSYAAVRTAGDGQEVVTEAEQDPVIEWDPVTGLPTEVEQDPEEVASEPVPDVSWITSSGPLGPGDRLPAEAEEAVLHLFSTGDDDASVTLAGGEQTDVAPYSSAQVELNGDGPFVEVEQSTGRIHGAVILRDAEGRFTVIGPPPAESGETSVPVTLRR
ncbi:DUF5719 family protein [Nesterenkonia populi]|uniref:DUF5719 family protein n=1 Tax=Nesterenkonia populi TaxID=1591087 RepID=UPI0011BF9898|nr:DUF5719 family protein [Nesterenkonia populi]